MKKVLVLTALLAIGGSAQAQWQNSPSQPGAVYNNGNVGIGVSNPVSVLHANAGVGMNVQLGYYAAFGTVYSSWATVIGSNVRAKQATANELENITTHSSYSGSAIVLNAGSGIMFHTRQGAATAGSTYSSPRMLITEAGLVGIGPYYPGQLLDVNTNTGEASIRANTVNSTNAAVITAQVGNGTSSSKVALSRYQSSDATPAYWDIGIRGTNDLKIFDGINAVSRVVVSAANGNVGIGTDWPTSKLHVVGDIYVTGNIGAKYQDVAEWVPAEGALAPGTVVIVAPGRENVVAAAGEAYDTRVAGVVSARPGLILGEPGASKVQVATTGRVKVKVDATNGPIQAGDLLVSAGRSGFAMKSVPMEINGRKFHQPGTLVGKALEGLEGGTGEILVLLSLQ